MLPAEIGNLSTKVLEAVDLHDKEGKRVVSKILKVRPRITQFNYNDGNISHGRTIEFVEREEWYIVDQYKFLQNTVKEFDEYKKCVKDISIAFGLDEKDADSRLTRYVQAIIGRYFDSHNEFDVLDSVTAFIQDLDESPIIWAVQGALVGITLKEEELPIHRFKLRRPVEGDFETEERIDAVALGMPRNDFDMLGGMPTAFIDYKTRAATQAEVHNEFNRILDLLRLYKLGSVSCLLFRPMPTSIIRMGSAQWHNRNVGHLYKYSLGSDDENRLQVFIEKNEKHLKGLAQEVDTTDRGSLNVSLKRYRDALSDVGPLESRITSAITCLESLLLKAQERFELSHRLSQRVSFLMNHFNFTPIKTYDLIQRAYEVRSTYIHGSELEQEKKKDLNEMAKSIMEYARISLCALLQVSENYTKDSIIKKIDNALLDENAQTKIKTILEEKVNVTLTE